VEPGSAHILIAEDDRLTREHVASILLRAGYNVETVNDGQEAVDRVAQGPVDLVLLDVVMPRMSGLEACRILKGMTVDGFLPVLIVTVKTDTQSRVEGLRIGADDYICKPFDEQELLARVASQLRIKKLHDQVAAQKAKFERLSVQDEMTGLCNYRYLNTRLSEEFKRAERYHEPFACVLVDIDQLRAVNDVIGRPAGDAVIKKVAEGIRRCVREVDVVARYGGDEFLLILPSTHFAGSIVVAERIWREVGSIQIEGVALGHDVENTGRASTPPASRRTWDNLASIIEGRAQEQDTTIYEGRRSETDIRWSGGPRTLTVSIGVALYPSRDVRTKDSLLRAADEALGQAKREGGNRICVFQQQGYIYTPAGVPSARAEPAAPRSTAGRWASSIAETPPTSSDTWGRKGS